MDEITRTHLHNLLSDDRDLQNDAYFYVMEATNAPVEWAYDVWDTLLTMLTDKDNHQRAIGAQVLCNLAKSDPDYRMAKDFDAILNVTKDERFVTARHALQSLWKVGVVGAPQQQQVVEGLERRFGECASEKNSTLLRYDIIQSLKNIYDEVQDERIRDKALELIESEEDPKYRKKYASVWKQKTK